MTLQTTLNAVSATPTTYVTACCELGLDPNCPILELATIAAQTKRNGTNNRELKLWQVQLLAWADIMENSRLREFTAKGVDIGR